MRIYPRFHSLHAPSTEVTRNGECRECYRAYQREWHEKNYEKNRTTAKSYRQRQVESGEIAQFCHMKCNQVGCGKTFYSLRDLAAHKRGHNSVPYSEEASSLPSSMGGGWNP